MLINVRTIAVGLYMEVVEIQLDSSVTLDVRRAVSLPQTREHCIRPPFCCVYTPRGLAHAPSNHQRCSYSEHDCLATHYTLEPRGLSSSVVHPRSARGKGLTIRHEPTCCTCTALALVPGSLCSTRYRTGAQFTRSILVQQWEVGWHAPAPAKKKNCVLPPSCHDS